MTPSSYGYRDWGARTSVAAVFNDRDDAEQAIKQLREVGFDMNSVGVAVRDQETQGELVEETGSHAAGGAATGAVSGGILGGIVGLLLGIGALAIPGIGPVVAGGVLASTFGVAGGTAVAGAGIGAVAGGIVGALIGMGIPKHEAEYFESGLREGKILVTVNAEGRANQAADILEANGGDTAGHFYDTDMRRPA